MSAPKKSYGQHFLEDRATIERILGVLAPRAADSLLEIGPGEGALTLPLLAATGTLTAIELDTELIPTLQRRAAAVGKLEVIPADILHVDLGALAQRLGTSRLRVVGNLPYYISSPILFHCLQYLPVIQDLHFMLQKEVVERMAAAPGSKIYGRLSVMLQLACRVELLFEVPARAFRPPPKVDSAVVRMLPLAASERPDAPALDLQLVVKAAFAQRRKTLGNALAQVLDREAIRGAGIDPGTRAETLEPAAFVRLAQACAARRGAAAAARP